METSDPTSKDRLPRSRRLAAKVVFAALQILKEKGGQAPGREVVAEVEKRVPLDEWATARYEKSGYVRWQSILHFFSIDCIKAGFLVKKKGVWYLTPEGEKALSLGEVGLHNAASAAYVNWRETHQPAKQTEIEEVGEEGEQGQEATLHEMEQSAIEGLKKQVAIKNAYEFQELLQPFYVGWVTTRPLLLRKARMVELM